MLEEMSTLASVLGRLITNQNHVFLPNFDCILQYVWDKFKLNGGTVDLDVKIIEAAVWNTLSENLEPTPALDLKVQFLLFITRLVDGERHYLFQYNPSPGTGSYSSTVLESAICIFDQIFQRFPEWKKQAEELRLKILQQAVFVCCRHGKFDLAKNVYEFAELEVNVDEAIWEELKLVVEIADSSHPALTENSYQQFCELMCEGLKFLVEEMPLQKCAQGCSVHVKSFHSENTHQEKSDKFDKDILKKLLHANIKSWLPKEHRTILEKEFLKLEHVSNKNICRAARNINTALCEMDLLKELSVAGTSINEFDGVDE